MLRRIRQLHLYLGIFIAPALLFFAFTGALQTVSLHETTKGSTYRPAKWIVVLAQVHKKQTTQVPLQKQQPASSEPKPSRDPQLKSIDEGKSTPTDVRAVSLKIFFLLVAVGLVTSTFSGLYMAYKYLRNRVAMTLLLVAGIVVPVVLTLS